MFSRWFEHVRRRDESFKIKKSLVFALFWHNFSFFLKRGDFVNSPLVQGFSLMLIALEWQAVRSNPISSRMAFTCWTSFQRYFYDLRHSLVATTTFLWRVTSKICQKESIFIFLNIAFYQIMQITRKLSCPLNNFYWLLSNDVL